MIIRPKKERILLEIIVFILVSAFLYHISIKYPCSDWLSLDCHLAKGLLFYPIVFAYTLLTARVFVFDETQRVITLKNILGMRLARVDLANIDHFLYFWDEKKISGKIRLFLHNGKTHLLSTLSKPNMKRIGGFLKKNGIASKGTVRVNTGW